MATEDARYRQSSQYRFWSFSKPQLADLRAKTNTLAKTSISQRLSPAAASAPASANGSPMPLATGTPGPEAQLPEFLTAAEELQLLQYYTVELLNAADFIHLSTDIRATAAVFLRRFYVTNSVMTYPLTDMLKTALFFGAKAEGTYAKLNKFASEFPDTKPEQILAGEYLLCQGIRFCFDVKHPFRGLEGAIIQLRSLGDIEEDRLHAAHVRAREILKFSSLVTDVYFHFTPSQIMFAALHLADSGLVDRLMDETFKSLPAGSDPTSNKPADSEMSLGARMRMQVMEAIEACREILATEPPERFKDYWSKPESRNIIKPLNKKLRKCRDPDRWDLVALQRAKKESAAPVRAKGADEDGAVFGGFDPTAAADEPQAKRRKVKEAADNPFGPALK